MSHAAWDTQRRTLLQVAAGLATASHLGLQATTTSAADGSTRSKPAATGKPGDFDFLSGNWKIKNRQFNLNPAVTP
ncbi:MAG: hypothetical protein HYX43_17505 [Burkholderiales bacterium]|nr:hypothetical protein [Burkholderiales bacterium]